MALLSVNVNKVATLRNSRGGAVPDMLRAVDAILGAGVRGITVHPREDERHITAQDVLDIHAHLRAVDPSVEYNIEGDPRPDLMETVLELRPTQCTLVPVRPGEITSEAGWDPTQGDALPPIIEKLRGAGIRVSVFVEPNEAAIAWAADIGADRIELYTEPFARAFERGDGEASFGEYAKAAEFAHARGLGINAGHDLDLANLPLFRDLPHLDEVSIGHAIMSEALFSGLAEVVSRYLEILAPTQA
jgi:pyridoxine 5-phosphate synthase